MSGNQANHEGGDTADSNQSLWQQYLDAMNKFQESQKAATYSSNPPPLAANNSVGPAATKVENTIDDSNTGVGLEVGWPGDDEDKQSVLTTPAPNNAHDNAQDDGDLVINFDNNNEVIFTSGQEETVSSKNETTPYPSSNTPYVNCSHNQEVTSDVGSKQDETRSTSEISAIQANKFTFLPSVPASLAGDFEHQQLVPAPLFNSQGALEVYKPESGSEDSDVVTYQPDRFDMARKRKNKGKKLAVAKIPSNDVQTVAPPNFPIAPAEKKEELKELQQKYITRAGNRALGIPVDGEVVTNEALALARQGPGTDPNSEVFKYIRSFVTDTPATRMIGYHDTSMQVSKNMRNPSLDRQMKGAPATFLRYYEDTPFDDAPDPHAVPVWSPDGNVQSSDGLVLAKAPALQDGEPTNWEKSFGSSNPDWLRPDMLYNREPRYLPLFRHWLETSIGLPEPVITNRLSFYDGTSHSDGVTSMFIPILDDEPCPLDFEDQENIDHSHETSSGYIYNTMDRKAREEEAAEESRRLSELDYRSMMVLKPQDNPNVPRANIYLRPIENHDINELTALYNWYVTNTRRTLELLEISEQDMMDRKNECRRGSMPFIVAVERRVETRNHFTEAVVGYASATDFTGSMSAHRHTAELELFVHPDRLNLGIANCLIDKLLSVCDRTYVMRQGYTFDSTPAGRAAYSPGGNRELARLIFIVHFQDSDNAEYLWVKDWLESRFMFEEQGLLKGVGYKHDKVMNTSYLVRNTGMSLRDITM